MTATDPEPEFRVVSESLSHFSPVSTLPGRRPELEPSRVGVS